MNESDPKGLSPIEGQMASMEALNAFLPDGLTIEGIMLRLLGMLPGAIGQHLLRRRIRRLEEFAALVKSRLATIDIRLDPDSFAFLIEKATRVAVEDHRDFKRGMLASILADAASADEVSIHRHFINLVDAMEPQHAALLRCLKHTGPEDPSSRDSQVSCLQYEALRGALPSIEDGSEALIDAVTFATLTFLLGNGLVGSDEQWQGGRYFLTPLGQRFMKFLEEAQAEKEWGQAFVSRQ